MKVTKQQTKSEATKSKGQKGGSKSAQGYQKLGASSSSQGHGGGHKTTGKKSGSK